MCHLNGLAQILTRLSSLKSTGIPLPTLSAFAFLPLALSILTCTFRKNAISKLNLVLKQWLICTTFSAIILLHQWIHSSKNYSLIFLHVFTLISSITLRTNTPRLMNQSIVLTHQFLHFIPTIRPIFLKYFYILLIFHATLKFLPQRRAPDSKKAVEK